MASDGKKPVRIKSELHQELTIEAARLKPPKRIGQHVDTILRARRKRSAR